MIPLPRALIQATSFTPPRFDMSPIQVGLGRDPWKVIVASKLLQRTRRNSSITERLFQLWPTPAQLATSDVALETLLHPLGLHRTRARQLQRMSFKYSEWAFDDVRDLPGCGPYVCDAVGLFCYGCTDLDSSDEVLHDYAFGYSGDSITYKDGWWAMNGKVLYRDPVQALYLYESNLTRVVYSDPTS